MEVVLHVEEGSVVQTFSGSKYRLGQPMIALSYPHLDQWKRLEGGSIAGIVTRHDVIPDGELITTSPLVEYDESHGIVVVETASGSRYQLGEPETVAVADAADSNHLKDDHLTKETEIESIAIPRAPDMAPPAHVFQSEDYTDTDNNDNQTTSQSAPRPPSTPPKIVLEKDDIVLAQSEHFFATPKPPGTPPKEIQEALIRNASVVGVGVGVGVGGNETAARNMA
jgi:hypothetical protein